MNRIDTCGMSCPQPVLMTKKSLEKYPEGIDIVVDNNTAKSNVERFLNSVGYTATILEKDELFIIEARK
jgi:TusA-related sulfurtransferase